MVDRLLIEWHVSHCHAPSSGSLGGGVLLRERERERERLGEGGAATRTPELAELEEDGPELDGWCETDADLSLNTASPCEGRQPLHFGTSTAFGRGSSWTFGLSGRGSSWTFASGGGANRRGLATGAADLLGNSGQGLAPRTPELLGNFGRGLASGAPELRFGAHFSNGGGSTATDSHTAAKCGESVRMRRWQMF